MNPLQRASQDCQRGRCSIIDFVPPQLKFSATAEREALDKLNSWVQLTCTTCLAGLSQFNNDGENFSFPNALNQSTKLPSSPLFLKAYSTIIFKLCHVLFYEFKLFQDQRQYCLFTKTCRMEMVFRKNFIAWNIMTDKATAGLNNPYLVMGNNLFTDRLSMQLYQHLHN